VTSAGSKLAFSKNRLWLAAGSKCRTAPARQLSVDWGRALSNAALPIAVLTNCRRESDMSGYLAADQVYCISTRLGEKGDGAFFW
jgi:hypothetical protein